MDDYFRLGLDQLDREAYEDYMQGLYYEHKADWIADYKKRNKIPDDDPNGLAEEAFIEHEEKLRLDLEEEKLCEKTEGEMECWHY